MCRQSEEEEGGREGDEGQKSKITLAGAGEEIRGDGGCLLSMQ